jgi:phage portal protein BeeE
MSNYTFADKLQLATWYLADKVKRGLKLSDPKAWNSSLWNLYGASQTESGVQVTEETALNLSSVYAAINIISSDISSLPIHLYRKQSNGKRKLITNHKSLERLNYQANPFMSAVNVRQTSMAHVLSWGNAYSEIVRNGTNGAAELWPIPPHRVEPLWMDGTIKYKIIRDGKPDYLQDIPRVLDYIVPVLRRYAQFSEMLQFLEDRVLSQVDSAIEAARQ